MKYSVINAMLSSVSYKKMVLRNFTGSVGILEFFELFTLMVVILAEQTARK